MAAILKVVCGVASFDFLDIEQFRGIVKVVNHSFHDLGIPKMRYF
jgi:hypothetical protein